MKTLTHSILIVCCLAHTSIFSQVQPLDVFTTEYNLTPSTMIDVLILNTGQETNAQTSTTLYGPSMEPLLVVQSQSFNVPAGSWRASALGSQVESVQYSSGDVSAAIQAQGILPAGQFTICVEVISIVNGENDSQQFCKEIISNYLGFLQLLSPYHQEEIETTKPTLLWNHSEPFTSLNSQERFRLVLVEQLEGQSSQEALETNNAVFLLEAVSLHAINYPTSAQPLKQGSQYAWKVQRLSMENVVAETDSWSFTIKNSAPEIATAYAQFKAYGTPYTHMMNSDKLYFKFDEEYLSGEFKLFLNGKDGKPLEVLATLVYTADAGTDKAKAGHNHFVADLSGLSLPSGVYDVYTVNRKNEKARLKIYVQ
jgi:hypothetical protein